MPEPKLLVHKLEHKDIQWPLTGDEHPTVNTWNPRDTWSRTEKVDPFPAYSHSLDTVSRLYHKMQETFPVGVDVSVFVLPYEAPGRWNGMCYSDHHYRAEKKDDEPYEYSSRILLYGKRTPLHPAMTRFVSVHEYGHAVESWIAYQLKMPDYFKFRTEIYDHLRPSDKFSADYNAMTWHKNIGEVIADDFRICVMGVETEHWPHYDIEYPTDVPAVVEFWEEAVEKYKYRPTPGTEDASK